MSIFIIVIVYSQDSHESIFINNHQIIIMIGVRKKITTGNEAKFVIALFMGTKYEI